MTHPPYSNTSSAISRIADGSADVYSYSGGAIIFTQHTAAEAAEHDSACYGCFSMKSTKRLWRTLVAGVSA